MFAIAISVFAAVDGAPGDAGLLVAGVGATFVMMLALWIATAGATNSPAHAQATTLPLSLGVIARGRLGRDHRDREPCFAKATAAGDLLAMKGSLRPGDTITVTFSQGDAEESDAGFIASTDPER